MESYTKPLILIIVLQGIMNLLIVLFLISSGHDQCEGTSEFQPDLVTFNVDYGTILVDEQSRFMLKQISIEPNEGN